MAKLPESVVIEVQYRDGYKCVYCDRGGRGCYDLWGSMCIDHFIPKARGGTDDMDNLKLACRVCNEMKKDDVYPTVEAVRRALAPWMANDRILYDKLIAKWETDQATKRAA